MIPTRSRAAGLAMATSLALIASLSLPASAADSPEAAVNELLDAVVGADYAAIDALVCEAERNAVRAQLDPGAAMGVDGEDLPLSFRIDDREVTLVSQEGDEATLSLTGTMSMEVAEGDMEDVARQILEAEMGEGLSDEDLEDMMPFIMMAFTQTMDMDEEIVAVRENGEWVVCGGLGEPVEDDFSDDDFGTVTNVSTEGVCGLVMPDELTAAGQLEYDGSNGFIRSTCSYTTSDFETYHTATVTVELDTDAAAYAAAYGADQQLEVAGAPAFASATEGAPLLVQVGPDLLSVSIWPPQPAPEGFDGQAQAIAVAELFVSRIPDSREELVEPVPPPLCDLSFAADFEAATGLFVHSGNVDGNFCNFEARETAYVSTNLNEGTIDQYLMFYPDAEELTVAELPALRVVDEFNESRVSVYVGLPDEQLLTVNIDPQPYDQPLELEDPLAVVELLTQHILDRQAENEQAE